MAITLNRLYTGNHQYDGGTVQINVPFVGNTLAVALTTKPEYADTNQRIGTLFQFYGNAQKAYDLYSGRDVVRLELPETDKLWFSPTSYLSDNYTLTIDYTNVGTVINGSNSASIPEQLLTLPARVLALEANPSISNWIDITNKPLVFPPAIHSHETSDVLGLTTALNGKANTVHTHLMDDVSGLITEFTLVNTSIGNVGNRVTALESSPASSSASQNYTSISTNITLESNKNYLAIVTGLTCLLPVNPTIGDVVNLSTGNFSLKVFHGSANQQILNSSTLSIVGTDSGIILNPYAAISITYLGSNLWVSVFRTRTINNWLDATEDAISTIKTYTPQALEVIYYYSDQPLSFINNGNKTTEGVLKSQGGTANELRVLLTFPLPTILTGINYWLGQFNGAYNVPTSVDIYRGSTVNQANLINSSPLPSAVGSVSISGGVNYSSTYVVNFKAPQELVGILELETLGRQIIGGEIPV